jgi:hypothetical protein
LISYRDRYAGAATGEQARWTAVEKGAAQETYSGLFWGVSAAF